MSDEFGVLKERIERLRKIHLKAIASFNAFEQLQEFRAPNLIGKELAQKHAEAVGTYKGFFNTAENALNTELHISVAKLFDSHRDALHIEKLVNYAEQNQDAISASQQAGLNEDTEYSNELAKVYAGLNHDDLLKIKIDLDAAKDKIARLKEVRDKQVAHEDIKKPELKYLTYEEFVELIELSEKILNLVSHKVYSDVAYFVPYKEQVVEDSKSLLRLVAKSEEISETNP
jgi:hypothetical protein